MKAIIALIAMGFAMTTVSFANEPATPATTDAAAAAKPADTHAADHAEAPAAHAKAKKKKAH